MKQKPVGWKNEPGRHGLAARGIKTKAVIPRFDEIKLKYAQPEKFNPRRLHELLKKVEMKPEYEDLETPGGQSEFLHDVLESMESTDLPMRGFFKDPDLSKGGLEYSYKSSPPSIVVSLYGEVWFDSNIDRIDSYDFLVTVSVLLIEASKNTIREDIARRL